jgi:hypothetical protein
MKNHFSNHIGVTSGVNAKKEKIINVTDITKLPNPINNSIPLQYFGVVLNAIGL